MGSSRLPPSEELGVGEVIPKLGWTQMVLAGSASHSVFSAP